MTMRWDREKELYLLQLRDKERKSYREIATILGTTVSSVKHKYLRLKQANNEDKHHHPQEKTEQIIKVLGNRSGLSILETNAGYGNLTKIYAEYGHVTAQDIDAKKVKHLKKIDGVTAIKCDSFIEIHRHIYERRIFDVVDLDPYGFPSRYFPHVFQLIDDGYLFVTFPKMGVQQINKITVEHYKVFWGITLEDKEVYLDKIHKRIKEYGLCYFRKVEPVDVLDLGRMYRLAYRVVKKSALELCNLKVRRGVDAVSAV